VSSNPIICDQLTDPERGKLCGRDKMRRARDSRAQGVWLAFGSPHPEVETQMPIVATATSMKYNQLGRTGLFVSEICLGTMTFGGSEGGDVYRRAILTPFGGDRRPKLTPSF